MLNVLEYADIAVIGGGLAAMEAALAAIKEEPAARVALLSKQPAGLSGASLVAMSVHRYAPREPELKRAYCRDFLASGQEIGDPALLEILAEEGAAALDALEALGMPLEFKEMPGPDGKMYRYMGCCRPKYGRQLTEPMSRYLLARPQVRAEKGCMALEVLTRPGAEGKTEAWGVLAEKEGRFYIQPAKAVILACGGSGFIYENTSNTRDLTGDGYALALRAGLPLRDMEFVQFYPYRIHRPGRANIFPDIFGQGAVFLNEKGERFMAGFPKKERENRDILTRQMFAQKEVIFDISGAVPAFVKNECSAVYDLSRKYNTRQFVVKPVAHFMMGGIPLRPDGGSGLPGLFCCGEVTGGLHGANRIAGSALTECAVFGARCGRSAAEYAREKGRFPGAGSGGHGNGTGVSSGGIFGEDTGAGSGGRENGTGTAGIGGSIGVSGGGRLDSPLRPPLPQQLLQQAEKRIQSLCPAPGGDDPAPIIAALRKLMWQKASLIRSAASLETARAEAALLEQRLKSQSPASLRLWLEAQNLFSVADSILASALMRKESRGAHFREDYPATDPAFAGHMVYQRGEAGFCKNGSGGLNYEHRFLTARPPSSDTSRN